MKTVSKRFRRPVYGLLLLLMALSASRSLAEAVPPPAGGAAYAGSGACAPCHPKQYASWEKTPHATTLRDARKFPAAILGDMADRDLTFRKEDITHTIGGHREQRYMTRIGDDYYVLPSCQWSIVNGKWRRYATYGWQKRPFSIFCAGCHSVAFDPRKKTAAEFGVGCEACHGPGARHVTTSAKGDIVQPARLPEGRRDEICAACHVRGKDPGDEYFFPVGWKPGEELDNYLVPWEPSSLDIPPGEVGPFGIHRLWEYNRRKIREKVGRNEFRPATDREIRGCGMDGIRGPICEYCHERGAAHVRHPEWLKIKCLDCHGIAPIEGPEAPPETDIHAPGYYRVHPANLWDNDYRKRCDRCHSTRVGDWSRESLRAWPARPPTEGLAVPGVREMEGYSVDRNPVFPPIVAKPREPVAAVIPRSEPAPRRPEPAPPAPSAAERSPAPVELAAPRSEAPLPGPAVTARKKEPEKPDGIARLLAEGKIARADAFYLDAWVDEAARKYGEVADWAIRGDRSRIFVVLDGRFDFPEGKKGDGRNVFIIPWRARTPYGERGDSTLYFLDRAACEGRGWPCDEIRRLERMPERERKLVPLLAKGILRKAQDADIRQWIDRWIRAGGSTPSGRDAKTKARTADRVRMSWNDTYVSNGRNWEVPEGVDFNFIVQEKREMPRNPSKTGTFYFLDTGSCEGRKCPE